MGFKILDASAFYAGVPFGRGDHDGQWATTPSVADEIRHIKKAQGVIDTMIETGRIRIMEPQKKFLREAEAASKRTGDRQQLSAQDISVLALCMEVKGEIVTDDFAVSNVAKFAEIKVNPIMTGGIKDMGTWIHYCPGCRKNFKNSKECPLCGNMLKRKLIK